ncbi:hypothetical protein C6Y44_26485 (plasmid) [Rhodococcus rhodochrous]|nr:hypothetical protein C6Y44_26485 [Rhodococcus rhodochrous]
MNRSPGCWRRLSTGHTRYPVVGDSADDLLGVVHLHYLLDRACDTGFVEQSMRPALALEAQVPVCEALRIMRGTRNHLATVTDDGSVVGLITLNDVLTRLMPAAGSAA